MTNGYHPPKDKPKSSAKKTASSKATATVPRPKKRS